jgi:rRNA maturation endonuclease Nob1
MIKLQWINILVMLVSFPLALTLIAALYYNFRSLHRRRRTSESIYECTACGHVYAFARSRPMDRCPRCGNLNEAVRT